MKRLAQLALLLLLASPVRAAIGFDAVSNSGLQLSTSPVSWSHTVGSGLSNSILLVGVAYRHGTATISSVTYGGTNLTNVRTDGPFDATQWSSVWYLLSPASGTNTISVTWSQGVSSVCGAVSLSGVDQTNPVDAQSGSGNTSGNPSVSVTTVADNAWIFDVVSLRTQATASLTMTAHTNRTQRWNVSSTGNNMAGAGSTLGPATPAGSFTMDWTQNGTRGWSESVVSFAPASAAAKKRLPLLGVGD